jgi:hypothetical protein
MAKKSGKNSDKETQLRVKRAEAVIDKVLKEENVMITANKVRVIFQSEDGKYTGGSVVDVRDLAKLLDRPTMLIMPQVQLEAKREAG